MRLPRGIWGIPDRGIQNAINSEGRKYPLIELATVIHERHGHDHIGRPGGKGVGNQTWQGKTHRTKTGALVWPVAVAGVGDSGSQCKGVEICTGNGGESGGAPNSRSSSIFPPVTFASSVSVSEKW